MQVTNTVQVLQDEKDSHKYTVEEIERALTEGRGLLTQAAIVLGCSRVTLYRYLDTYPQLRDTLVQAKEAQLDRTESKLFEAIERNEPWSIAFYLKTQGKQRGYIERSEQVRLNVDVSLVQSLTAALEQAGLNPAQVLQAMLEQVSSAQLPASTTDESQS